jgi:ABC-2 type transport system permease protein
MRLRDLAREPGTLFWVFGVPILLSLALGIAFRAGPAPVAVGVLPGIDTTLQAAMAAAGLDVRLVSAETGQRELRDGHLALLLAPPDIPNGPFNYVFDPTRVEGRLARVVTHDAVERARGRHDQQGARDRPITQPGSRYIDFLIPGLIGMNLMSSSIWAIAWLITMFRARKLLKRFVASPMRRWHFLVSQVLARMVLLPLEVGTILVFAHLAFDVPLSRSWLTLAVVCIAGNASFAGIGLLLACRVESSDTIGGLINVATFPMTIVSGVFFSSARFPEVVQPLIAILPLTALIDALRAVILDGAGIVGVQRSLVVLLGWTVASFVIGLRAFRWE